MGKKKNDEYYAVIRGFYLTVPTIFSSWGDAHPLVTGFRKPDFGGFKTLAKAEEYMEDHGVEDYKYEIKQGAGETTPEKNQTAYYAVANGRTPGIREYYYGSGGAEPEVVRFSRACHKHFRTLAQAEAFIVDWVEMCACVVKANTKEELLDGYRPAKLKGTPVGLSLKTEGGGADDDELTDGLSKMRI